MRWSVLFIFLLILPFETWAAPCSNPRTCEAPAWVTKPPEGTSVGHGATRIEAFSRALASAAQQMQAKVNQMMAGYAKSETKKAQPEVGNSMTNQAICGLQVKSMTKTRCDTADCKTGKDSTYVAKISMGDVVELKVFASSKTQNGKSTSEANISMTGKNADFIQLLKKARDHCMVNEVFSKDLIWVVIKPGK